jgi:4-alpha-glucanotransferase
MERYFDAYRIDHILGFFRIWEIPSGYRSGIMGHFNPALPLSEKEILDWGLRFRKSFKETLFFEDPVKKGLYHPGISAHKSEVYKALSEGEKLAFNRLYEDFFYVRHNKFWERIGYQKLPEIVSASNMLPCAEDLGMIPDCVPGVLRDLKILTLEVQRMPKEYGCSVGNPARYPYLSVCTTGTHDMETLRGWKGECPKDEVKEIIREHLESPAMLTILPLQDWLALTDHLRVENPEDERINTPSDPNNRWRYRMNISLEDLKKESHLNGEILSMIKELRG